MPQRGLSGVTPSEQLCTPRRCRCGALRAMFVVWYVNLAGVKRERSTVHFTVSSVLVVQRESVCGVP